jgi:hypothetical protein
MENNTSMCSKYYLRSPTTKLSTRHYCTGYGLAVSLGIKRLLVYGDFLLVVQQVNKEWDINKDTMDAYVTEICKLESKFSGLEIHHVIHDNNVGADLLSKLVLIELASHQEFSFTSCITHRLHPGAQTTPRRRPKNC